MKSSFCSTHHQYLVVHEVLANIIIMLYLSLRLPYQTLLERRLLSCQPKSYLIEIH